MTSNGTGEIMHFLHTPSSYPFFSKYDDAWCTCLRVYSCVPPCSCMMPALWGDAHTCGFLCCLNLHICSLLSFHWLCWKLYCQPLSPLSVLVCVGWLAQRFSGRLLERSTVSITLFCCSLDAKSCPTLRNLYVARQAPLSSDGHSSCIPACSNVCPKLPRVVEYLILDLYLLFLTVFMLPPLLVETCEITLYFPFVNCLDALSFYLILQ